MGRVTVEIRVESLGDLIKQDEGTLAPEQVRTVVIPDALVDTGATMLALPTSAIRKLGLKQIFTKRTMNASGPVEVAIHQAVRLTIMDRFCTLDVMEVPDGVPALVGQIPLEQLDFVVDMQGRKLTGNPAHGGEHMFELY